MLSRQRRRFTRAYMSDTKWRKVFRVVNTRTLALNLCVWKLVDTDEPLQGHLPDFEQLGADYVGDCGALNGPFPFRDIEWLLIPVRHEWKPYYEGAPSRYLEQNLESVLEQLQTVGQFEIG